MPPPSVPSSALPKAGSAGKAADSQESTAGQAPAAKGPPVPKVGGVAVVQGPPAKPASDSAVMAKSSTKESQSPQTIQGHFPTLAESVGKTVPVKKPPPTGKPKARSSSLSLKAAYASVSSTTTPGKGEGQQPVSSARGWSTAVTTRTGQAAQASSSKGPPKTLEEKGKEMMAKKQEEKDPGIPKRSTSKLERDQLGGAKEEAAEGEPQQDHRRDQQDSYGRRAAAWIVDGNAAQRSAI